MSENINQVFIANPITSNAATDLMYFGQSPYGPGDDAAMTYANFAAQFTLKTLTSAHIFVGNGSNVATDVAISGDVALANTGAMTVSKIGGVGISLAGAFTTIGAFAANLTFTGITNVTFPTSGTLATTSQIPTGAALTKTDDTNVTLTLGGSAATALVNAASLTLGWTGVLSATRGGTGVNNGSSTITLGGSLSTVGAFASTFTMTNTTNVTFPTSGTLATTSQLITSPLTTKGDLWGFTTVDARLPVGTTNGQILQVASGAAAGLAYSTATYPTVATSTGSFIYANGTNFVASTSLWPNTVGTAGKIIRSDGTTNAYSTSTFADTYAVSTLLFAGSANAVSGLATANSAQLITGSTGVPVWSATLTNGQMIIGSTGATPVAGTITGSGNLTVTVGAGTLALSLTGPASFAYNNVSGTTQAAAVNNGYIIGNASQTTVTLPATAAQGSVIAVQGSGAAGWILTANTGQTIKFGSSTTTSAGSLTSTNQYDAVEVVCIVANTTWAVKDAIGNLTVS